MKPSQRIMEIISDKYFGEYIELPNAIMNYLDEEYIRNKPVQLLPTNPTSTEE